MVLSLTPVMVIVCGVRALAGVKVRVDGDTVASVGLDEVTVKLTSVSGTEPSTTVKVSVPAFSATWLMWF